MKALSLTQPHASLIAIGAKRIETRSWKTSYRGPLAIHAAKGFPREARKFCLSDPFSRCLYTEGPYRATEIPIGCMIATCELVNCVEIVDGFYGVVGGIQGPIGEYSDLLTEQERSFGNYSAGRYAWILSNIVQLPTPIPARGALSLWEWNG